MNEHDPIWNTLRQEAQATAQREPVLAELLHISILDRATLEDALSHRLPRKFRHHAVSEAFLQKLFLEIFQADPYLGQQVRRDLLAVKERDPACKTFLNPFLYFKGYQALTGYRMAHWLWRNGRTELALYLQSIISETLAVDIHPAARIGCGILLDHATGIVVGETAVIEDDVSILHEVTLGGTGKETGDRHPKVRRGVLIGAGAKLLGNIEIGECAKIGAGSVVLQSVPAHMTAAGVPAKVVGSVYGNSPSLAMDHTI